MADETYLVPPVERNLMPLVVRRAGPREGRQQGGQRKEPPHAGAATERKPAATVEKNVISASKIDCKV